MYKIAVVGVGPSGIAMGAELIQAGIPASEVLFLEKTEHDNASIRQFYPAGKDINSVYKNMEIPQKGQVGFTGLINLEGYHNMMGEIMKKNDFKVVYNTEVQKVAQISGGFELETSGDTYEAEYVVLSSGVFSKPRKPDYAIAGALVPKISYDIVNIQKEKCEGLDILVVGGGNSASEYAQSLALMGNNITLSYRQDKFFRINQLNLDRMDELEKANKQSTLLGTNITSLEDDNGRIKVNFKERDAMTVDRIVYSLGGASPVAFMNNCGLDYDDSDVVLRDNNETAIDKLFMIGDVSAGRKGGSLMFAFNGARSVMEALHHKYQFPSPK